MTATTGPGTTVERAPAAPNPALDGHLLRIIAGGTKRSTVQPTARAAQRRADRYRRFLDALGVAVYTTDSDGKITFFNAAAADFWGRRPDVGEEWCGSLRLLYLDETPMRHDECPMAITLKEARPVRGGQAIAVRPDGSNVSFMAYPTPLFDDRGELIGAVNVLVDITERHRAEQAIRAAADALEASNAVKDEFLGLVSHELRTPVTTIFGNARLLQTHGSELDDDVRASMIADIATDADRLHSIIENLLHLTRLGSGARLELEPQVLDRAVEQAVASFRARNPDRTVEVSSERPRAIIEGDDTYITLLLENLLNNAVKYSPHGSPVEVEITTAGDEVMVEVLDRGIGLDDVDTGRLFEPFFRAEPARTAANGLGIGLALCQRIVAALGGRIWARPRDGGGAAVGFALPVAPEISEPIETAAPTGFTRTDRPFDSTDRVPPG
jgi:PAS domain S-box-containing protein